MSTPQQPELRRSGLGSTGGEGTEIRAAAEEIPETEGRVGEVPEANRPGHKPARQQDKPTVPPHERHKKD
jgi:hypothetical protein